MGGAGNDILLGGTGDDVLDGEAGNDVITTGTGRDRIVLRRRQGFDRITDFLVLTGFEFVREEA